MSQNGSLISKYFYELFKELILFFLCYFTFFIKENGMYTVVRYTVDKKSLQRFLSLCPENHQLKKRFIFKKMQV